MQFENTNLSELEKLQIKREKKRNRSHQQAEILKQQRLEERNYKPYICLECGKEFTEDYRIGIRAVKNNEPKFCCHGCTVKYYNKHHYSYLYDINQTKFIECAVCHELKEVNIDIPSVNFICDDCKAETSFLDSDKRIYILFKLKEKNIEITKESFYKACKDFVKRNTYKYPENCVLGKFERSQAFKNKPINLIKVGFNFDNPNWEEEFFKIRNLLYDLYYEQKLSANEISQKYNLQTNVPKFLLKLFGFEKFRNIKEALSLMMSQGNSGFLQKDPNSIYRYKTGFYKVKTGEEYFYRSSYELETIKFLETRNIKFTLNKFHINYISSKDNIEHGGYPDFYLPDYNLLIEIKNKYFYNEQNLIDRYQTSIKNLGIDFIVLNCKGYVLKTSKVFKFKGFEVLKSFIEDKNKEKEILNLLELKIGSS